MCTLFLSTAKKWEFPMPNAANKSFFESIVPRETCLKSWFSQLSNTLGIDYETIKYYYLDKRSKRLSQSRLIVVSDKISSVRSNIKHLRQIQGELHDSSIKSIFKPTKGND